MEAQKQAAFDAMVLSVFNYINDQIKAGDGLNEGIGEICVALIENGFENITDIQK